MQSRVCAPRVRDVESSPPTLKKDAPTLPDNSCPSLHCSRNDSQPHHLRQARAQKVNIGSRPPGNSQYPVGVPGATFGVLAEIDILDALLGVWSPTRTG